MTVKFPSRKTTALIDALVAALEAAPEKERADLERALQDKIEAHPNSIRHWNPIARWMLEAINEGVDGRILIPGSGA